MAPFENQIWGNSTEVENQDSNIQDIIKKLDSKFYADEVLNDTNKINELYEWYNDLNDDDKLKLKSIIDKALTEWYKLISNRSYENVKKLLMISFANSEWVKEINMPNYEDFVSVRKSSWLTDNIFTIKKSSESLNNWYDLYWNYWEEPQLIRKINFITWTLDHIPTSTENSISWRLNLEESDTTPLANEEDDLTKDQQTETTDTQNEQQETADRAEIEWAITSVAKDSKKIFNLSVLETISTHLSELVKTEKQKLQEASDKELSKWFVVDSQNQYAVIEKLVLYSSNSPTKLPSYSEIFSIVENKNWSTNSFALMKDGDGFLISMIDKWNDWNFYTWEPIWKIDKDWVLSPINIDNWDWRVSMIFDEPKLVESTWEESQENEAKENEELSFDVDWFVKKREWNTHFTETELDLSNTEEPEAWEWELVELEDETTEAEEAKDDAAVMQEEKEKINLTEYKVKKWETLWKIIKKKYGLRKNVDVVNAIKQIVALQPAGPIKDKLEKNKDKDWIPGQLINPNDKILLPDSL